MLGICSVHLRGWMTYVDMILTNVGSEVVSTGHNEVQLYCSI